MNGIISTACGATRPESLEDVYGELVRLRNRIGEAEREVGRSRSILCGPWLSDPCAIEGKSPEPVGAVSAHSRIVSEMHELISDLMNHLSYVNEAIGSRQ